MIKREVNCQGILTHVQHQNLLRLLVSKYFQMQIQKIDEVNEYSKIEFVKE
jgi:hypothetical protein